MLRLEIPGRVLPPADERKVFERFYRVARSSSPRVEGIGLGLSLAREIVQAHGGELLLKENRPKAGLALR